MNLSQGSRAVQIKNWLLRTIRLLVIIDKLFAHMLYRFRDCYHLSGTSGFLTFELKKFTKRLLSKRNGIFSLISL
jgi:hypothetical protein